MALGRTGQLQVLTAVLIGGILVAGITSAYLWGLPILQKNQDVNQVRQTLGDIRTVADAAAQVAQSGGSRQVPIGLGSGSITINTTHDFIQYQTLSRGAYVSTTQWVPLNENDLQGVNPDGSINQSQHGVRGPDKPALLVAKAERAGERYLTRYKIVFRNLVDPSSGQTYRIDLVQDGAAQASGGTYTVTLQKGVETVDSGAGIDGGTLRQTELFIRVS